MSTDLTQWGLFTRPKSRLSHTDRLRCLLFGKQETFNLFNVTALYQLNFNLSKFARPVYFCFLIRLFGTSTINFFEENSQYFCTFFCNFFTAKCSRSRWENLDCGQYRFKPIKFVNSVVPSPCETQPYNNCLLLTEQEVCLGESWPRSWVQTERSEVCTHHRGQDSPIQTD